MVWAYFSYVTGDCSEGIEDTELVTNDYAKNADVWTCSCISQKLQLPCTFVLYNG